MVGAGAGRRRRHGVGDIGAGHDRRADHHRCADDGTAVRPNRRVARCAADPADRAAGRRRGDDRTVGTRRQHPPADGARRDDDVDGRVRRRPARRVRPRGPTGRVARRRRATCDRSGVGDVSGAHTVRGRRPQRRPRRGAVPARDHVAVRVDVTRRQRDDRRVASRRLLGARHRRGADELHDAVPGPGVQRDTSRTRWSRSPTDRFRS